MPRRTRCWRCQHEVLWTVTKTGRWLAVDRQPPQEGHTAVFRDGAGTYRSRRPTEELPAAPWERMYIPHVAACSKHAEESRDAAGAVSGRRGLRRLPTQGQKPTSSPLDSDRKEMP